VCSPHVMCQSLGTEDDFFLEKALFLQNTLLDSASEQSVAKFGVCIEGQVP